MKILDIYPLKAEIENSGVLDLEFIEGRLSEIDSILSKDDMTSTEELQIKLRLIEKLKEDVRPYHKKNIGWHWFRTVNFKQVGEDMSSRGGEAII